MKLHMESHSQRNEEAMIKKKTVENKSCNSRSYFDILVVLYM